MNEINNPFKLTDSFYKDFFDFCSVAVVPVKGSDTIDLPAGRVGVLCSNKDLHIDSIEHFLNCNKTRITKSDVEALINRFTIVYLTNNFRNFYFDGIDRNQYPT